MPASTPLEQEALFADGIVVRLSGTTVLRGLGLHLKKGEILGVFGPSGAGKSTLFRALSGEEPMEAGRVFLKGQDVSALPLWRRARKGLGYLPQTPSVLLDLSVKDNLLVFARLCARPEREREREREREEKQGPALSREGIWARLLEWAQRLGLGDRMAVPAGMLSGGERRRLELVRALCGEPDVLLCDEPFAALDPIGTERISIVLKEAARQQGMAILLCDHHLTEALRLCDRAMLLLEGERALVAAADEFGRHELVRARYAGPP